MREVPRILRGLRRGVLRVFPRVVSFVMPPLGQARELVKEDKDEIQGSFTSFRMTAYKKKEYGVLPHSTSFRVRMTAQKRM